MTNKEIYQKTIGFSLRRIGWDIVAVLILAVCGAAGFFGAEKLWNMGLIGLGGGAIVGLILLAILLRYVSYTYKAGQIAMMTKAVTEGSLPDDTIAAGKEIVHERFTTVAVYFAATGVIKGIFNQIGRSLTKLGESIGGDAGNAVGSAVSAAVSTVVAYLCDCCLGWIFFRKEEKATTATLEGAALFFKHGKTLAKNMGRVFGMGLLSLLLIGGVFFGILYLVFNSFPAVFSRLAAEISEAFARGEISTADTAENVRAFLTNPSTLMIGAAVLGAIIIWSILHSAFVRPFVLVGVLRNYLESGMNDIPTKESYDAVAKISPKFAKLQSQEA